MLREDAVTRRRRSTPARGRGPRAAAGASTCRAGPTTCWPGEPYADRAALLAVADEAARALTDDELEPALSGHPRIGERGGAGHDAATPPRAGRRRPGDADVAARLAAGNAAYEERFDRVFLIRAAGRDAERRSWPSSTAGSATTTRPSAPRPSTQLREIALLRLEAACV